MNNIISNEEILDNLLRINKCMPAQRTDPWLRYRFDKTTGTEVGPAIGLGYRKRADKIQLLFKKCGYDPNPFTGNENTRWGTYWEPYAIKKFEEKMNCKVIEFNIIPHPTIEFLAYSMDGLAIWRDEKGNIIDMKLIEIKCPKTRTIKHEIPSYYYPQVQSGLNHLKHYGLDTTCYFIQYKPAEATNNNQEILDILEIQRNDMWWNDQFPKLVEFWNDVLYYREIGIQNHPEHPESKKLRTIYIDTFNDSCKDINYNKHNTLIRGQCCIIEELDMDEDMNISKRRYPIKETKVSGMKYDTWIRGKCCIIEELDIDE